MNQPSAYVLLGLTAIVGALAALVTFALLKFITAARDTRNKRGDATEAVLPAALQEAVTKLKSRERVVVARSDASERLSDEIADALMSVLQPQGVGVVIEAQHLCMMMRGVEKQHSAAVTSAMLGCFRQEQETRSEFLSLIRNRTNGV